jgi:hypothetical protein
MQIPSRILSRLYGTIEDAEEQDPNWPENPFIQLALIQEKTGALSKTLIDLNAATYNKVKPPTTPQIGFVEESQTVIDLHLEKMERKLEDQLLLTAAMCLRMLAWMNEPDEKAGSKSTD